MKDKADTIFENKEFHASILNSIVNGIWVSDKDDVIYYANERMGEIAGIPVDKIVGARVLIDFSEDTLKHFSPFYLKAKETLQEVYYESVSVITPARRQSYQSGWLIPRSIDGMFDGMICTVEDITERKQAENELAKHRKHLEELVEERTGELSKSEKSLRLIYDTAVDVLFQLQVEPDDRFRFLSVNRAFLKATGLTEEQILGKTTAEVIPEPSHSLVLRKYNEAIRKKRMVTWEETTEYPSGGKVGDVAVTPAFDQDGNCTHLIGSVHDITNRKKAEEDLRETILLNKILMDSMPCVALLLRPSTREIVASNEMAEKVGAVPGKQCFATWGRSDKPCPWCRAPKLWASGKAQHKEFEGHGITWDAHWIPVSEDLYMHFAFDITERKRLEEELRKMHKLDSIGVLAGGIAHDFNNLLAAVRSNVYMSKAKVSRKSSVYKMLESAENSLLMAATITGQLLTFAKGGAPIKEAISIIEIIKESAEFALSGCSIKCEYNMADNLWPVEADMRQIYQALHNIILNAVQSMPDGGTIRVSAENSSPGSDSGLPLQEGRYIKIVIQDQGIGIAEEHLQKIFDPYFSTQELGRGLGLSIVYSIIKNHDGHILAESEKGVGTTFTIYLPAGEEQIKEEKLKEKKTIEDTVVAVGGKILLMDDEEIIRESIGQLLTYKGYEVECVKDGDEAIELYTKAMETSRPFDAVILDLTIRGGMGGKETIQKLLEIDPNVKAIVASGYSNDPVLANFEGYGFTDVFNKASEPEELLDALNRVFNK